MDLEIKIIWVCSEQFTQRQLPSVDEKQRCPGSERSDSSPRIYPLCWGFPAFISPDLSGGVMGGGFLPMLHKSACRFPEQRWLSPLGACPDPAMHRRQPMPQPVSAKGESFSQSSASPFLPQTFQVRQQALSSLCFKIPRQTLL